MGYPLRIQLPNKTYHTESRCHNLQNHMSHDKMKEMLEEVLVKAQRKYRFELVSYEIVDDQFHFIIKTLPKEASISKIMQFIKSRYALKFNRKAGKTGAFWNERYKDVIIENIDEPEFYFLWLLWYLAFLPVRLKKVKNPRDYKYHSIPQYLGIEKNPRVQITLHKYFINLGKTYNERVKKFLEFEEIYRRRLSLSFL